MIKLFITFMFGGIFGFVVCALMVAAKDKDEGHIGLGECTVTVDPIVEYKCKTRYDGWCGNTCCYICSVADECEQVYKCKNNPFDCKQSITAKEIKE